MKGLKKMTEKKLQYFKKLLTKQLDDLQNKDSSTPVSQLAESEQIPDFTDQATLESDIDMNIHIRERDSKLILKIKKALERIVDESYGICEECGEEISEKRLKARPVTNVCINCKREQENQERLRGI
jgi:DnaK suppressor protein